MEDQRPQAEYLIYYYNNEFTSSVAAEFGRHGMPPPAADDTGTAF